MSNAINQNGTGLEQQIAGLDLNGGNIKSSNLTNKSSTLTSAARYLPPHLRGSNSNSLDNRDEQCEKDFKSDKDREYRSDYRRGNNRPNNRDHSERNGNYNERKPDEYVMNVPSNQHPFLVDCSQLSWGSVRLCTNSNKSMQIKNTSNKRLIIKVEVSGPGFQISNNQGNLITLQSQECQLVSLNFCPTVIGTAVGVLSFSARNRPLSQTYLDVPLYGYGGTDNLEFSNIMIAPIGNPFITMGYLKDLSGPIEKTYEIHNDGNLHGFVVIIIHSFGLPQLRDCFEVSPNKLLIAPKSVATVRVTLKPSPDAIKEIVEKISDVLVLANMRIVCGDEPTRQRICKLIRIMTTEEKSKFNSKSLDTVWASFPGEKAVDDLETLREKSEAALDLKSLLRINEIALTLNRDTFFTL